MSATEWILSGLAVALALWVVWLLMALNRTYTALTVCRAQTDYLEELVSQYEGPDDDEAAGQ